MGVPCVRVDPSAGEAVRSRLAELDLVDEDLEITVEDGDLFVPITDPERIGEAGLAADFDVVTHDVPARDGQTMPADLLSFDPSYERLGDIAIIDEDDPDEARAIAEAIADSDLPVSTVLNRASEIQGTERVRDWEVLAGDSTETVHREYGCEFALDLDRVYFSPRLATERHRVAQQIEAEEHVFDMFAGVGPFVVPAANRGATVVGVDVNPAAIEYLRENASRNDVAERVMAIEGDVRTVTSDYRDWADRIVMNLPHSADEFLETAVDLASDECLLHYYDIQPEEDPYGPGTRAIRTAAEPEYTVAVETERSVRSYAPGQLNVVIDARLRRNEA